MGRRQFREQLRRLRRAQGGTARESPRGKIIMTMKIMKLRGFLVIMAIIMPIVAVMTAHLPTS